MLVRIKILMIIYEIYIYIYEIYDNQFRSVGRY